MKIGFVGLAEEPWLDALDACIDVDQIEYVDFNESLRTNSQKLRQQDNCDLVIAINHMRLPNDQVMAHENDSKVVDMILGGHDHCYHRELTNTDVYIQKSDTDFECFSNLTVL